MLLTTNPLWHQRTDSVIICRSNFNGDNFTIESQHNTFNIFVLYVCMLLYIFMHVCIYTCYVSIFCCIAKRLANIRNITFAKIWHYFMRFINICNCPKCPLYLALFRGRPGVIRVRPNIFQFYNGATHTHIYMYFMFSLIFIKMRNRSRCGRWASGPP